MTIIVLLLGPYATNQYFTITQQRGYYPPNADSIAIPIFSYFFGWLFIAPTVFLVIINLTKEYKGKISIFYWSRYKAKTAFFYSLIAAVWIIFKGTIAVDMVKDHLLVNAVYDGLWVVLAFWIRACAVFALDPPETRRVLQKSGNACSCDNLAYMEGKLAENYISKLTHVASKIQDRKALFICPSCNCYWEKSYSSECSRETLAQITGEHVQSNWY
jgi:hypothetical protein